MFLFHMTLLQKLVESQRDEIEKLKEKVNALESRTSSIDLKRVEYLNISFYLSRIMTELCDMSKES